MGAFSRTLEGRFERPVPHDFFARVAERARAGHFGGRSYAVEELGDEGGYRSAPRARGLRLRASSGRPGPLDDVTLEAGPEGNVRWRLDLERAMWIRFLVSSAIVLAAALAFSLRTHSSSLLFAAPILAIAIFSFFSNASKADAAARKAIETALNAELDDERVDRALASSGMNAALAQDVVATAIANGIALGEDERARILECDDATVLEQWSKSARNAKTSLELFDGPRLRVAEPEASVDVVATVEGEEAANDDDEASAPERGAIGR